jgi:hypothetical protein
MAQDLEAGRQTEVRFLTGTVDRRLSQAVTRRIIELEQEVLAGGRYAPVDAGEIYR